MFVEVITTITTKIDMETFEPEHSVEVACEDGVPESFALAAALGGAKSTVLTLEAKTGLTEESD
jgi:hypothetical protein